MKYALNNRTITVHLDQDVISEDKISYHHKDFISEDKYWYKRGYISVQVRTDFLQKIRQRTYEYVSKCVQEAASNKLSSLQDYNKVITTDEAHKKVLRHVGKVIHTDTLGIDTQYLAHKIQTACGTASELGCLDVCDIRIFRPYGGNIMDNNPLHRDTWLPVLKNCINVYIPVSGNNRLSSLSLIPGSHLWNKNEVMRTVSNACFNGTQYGLPSIAGIRRNFKVIRPRINDSEVLLFSSNIIHGGAVNLNKDVTRVSIEIRFWEKSKLPEIEIPGFKGAD